MYAVAPKPLQPNRCVQRLYVVHNRIKCKCAVEFGGTGLKESGLNCVAVSGSTTFPPKPKPRPPPLFNRSTL